MISIIIPAYNIENYISRCLDSIFNQGIDPSTFEVVVVNDGSTDGTLRILNEYAQRKRNLIVETQLNRGPSAARNRGIELSRGEFLWFVDGDDYICPNSLSFLIDKITNYDFDILFFTIILKDIDGRLSKYCEQPVKKNTIISGKQALIEKFYPCSSCIALWKRDFINTLNLRFRSDIMYAEDTLFSYFAVCHATKIFFTDESLYFYEKRKGSSTTKDDLNRIINQRCCDIEVAISMRSLSYKLKNCDAELAVLIYNQSQNILFGLVYSLFMEKFSFSNNRISNIILEHMKKKNVYPLRGKFDSWKKQLMAWILNFDCLIR